MKDDVGFYRTELSGERMLVSFDEIHELRKDILLYFDDNIGEKICVLLPNGKFDKSYWQYISISFEQEWAESVKYKKVVEEGCLALLNGISLELLDQPTSLINKVWLGTNISVIISYLECYKPSSERLELAKCYLLKTYHFILKSTFNDLDRDGMIIEFNPAEAGEWFDKEIVQEYFRWKLESIFPD